MPYYETPDFGTFVLGQQTEACEVRTREEVRAAAVSMARQARRTLDIVTRDLDAPVYDDAEFLEAARRLVLESPRTRIRILVHDTGPAVTHGHRLIEFARRASSFVDIRVPAEEHARYTSAFLVADTEGVIFRLLADRYEGTVNFAAPGEARDLVHTLDEMWQVATPDPNLRRLHV